MNLHFFTDRFRNSLLLCIVLLVFAHIVTYSLVAQSENNYLLKIEQMFTLAGEGNFPAYFSGLILMVAAALFALISLANKTQKDEYWRYWLALGAIFTFLSFDEVVQIHEKFDSNSLLWFVKTQGLLAWPWVILYGGLVLLSAIVFFRFWWNLAASHRIRFAGCAVLYVSSALGFEMLEALEKTTNGSTTYYWILITIEETFEMLAIVFLIATLLRYIYKEMPQLLIEVQR